MSCPRPELWRVTCGHLHDPTYRRRQRRRRRRRRYRRAAEGDLWSPRRPHSDTDEHAVACYELDSKSLLMLVGALTPTTLRVYRQATVKDIGLPESLHPTTNARRYMVAAGVAETATWDPCVELPSPAASRQLRDELLVGSSSVGGPWGSGPRWLRPSGPRGRGPPAGRAPLAGRQPGPSTNGGFPFMLGFVISLLGACERESRFARVV